MNLKPATLLMILPVLAACQAEQSTQKDVPTEGSALQAPSDPEASAVSYRCESGSTVEAMLDGERALNLTYGGQTMNLQAEAVNSGAAYRNAQYRWVLSRGAENEEAQLYRGDTLLETCSRHQLSGAPQPGLAPCRADQLDLKPGETDAAMGHRQQTFEVALKGDQPCLLPAWPVVHLEGEGSSDAPPVVRTTDAYFGTRTVQQRQTLTSERAVMFHLGWSVIPDETIGTGACPKVIAMNVTAPGGGTLTPVAQSFAACGRGVVVSPFRPTTIDARKTD